ncbi:hypothetical protein DYU11_24430 [Fibrisoma montanum]|uniref:Uncharacterized protein n=1 Tax=Fibrisoma montanum TaxID=2305895 RepID=A0A418M106_9BACT|nr:hypothetical protein [Fibrisoma montanum]RIV19260.1 hypothetical protein DYU11_24430 [Fibrisoma montanum]
MSRYLLVGVLLGLTILSNACRNRRQADSKAADSLAAVTGTTESGASIVSGRLDSLGLTPDSHWRGINLGDPIATVRTTEKGELFENDNEHVGYTVEFSNLESADFLYYQKGQHVSAIVADIFLNTPQSAKAYQQDLQTYFTARYGQPVTQEGAMVWTGPKAETISVRDVSKGKDYGLKIRINPADALTTASAR